jgi:hypothetical protein
MSKNRRSKLSLVFFLKKKKYGAQPVSLDNLGYHIKLTNLIIDSTTINNVFLKNNFLYN